MRSEAQPDIHRQTPRLRLRPVVNWTNQPQCQTGMSLLVPKDADVCVLASRSANCDSNHVPDVIHVLARIHVDDEAQLPTPRPTHKNPRSLTRNLLPCRLFALRNVVIVAFFYLICWFVSSSLVLAFSRAVLSSTTLETICVFFCVSRRGAADGESDSSVEISAITKPVFTPQCAQVSVTCASNGWLHNTYVSSATW